MGGTEDNDLHCRVDPPYKANNEGDFVYVDERTVRSVWVPSDEERQQIASGANIELVVWTNRTPPVAVGLAYEPVGKKPAGVEEAMCNCPHSFYYHANNCPVFPGQIRGQEHG